MAHDQPSRTITVTTRARTRFSRLTALYPDRPQASQYDAARARELLARTGELPHSKRDLIIVLTEYRHALHSLATQPATTSTDHIT